MPAVDVEKIEEENKNPDKEAIKMQFKEAIKENEVIYQDNLEKIFDNKTVETFLDLEKTIQDFWNVDRKSANFLNLAVKMINAK